MNRVGIDIMEIGELRRLASRGWFLRFGYAPEEVARSRELGPERRLEYLAGRFAAKEAVLKLLGTGIGRGVMPGEIFVDGGAGGAPVVRFRGQAAALDPPRVAVSISHKRNVVVAIAVAVCGAGPHAPLTERKDLHV